MGFMQSFAKGLPCTACIEQRLSKQGSVFSICTISVSVLCAENAFDVADDFHGDADEKGNSVKRAETKALRQHERSRRFTVDTEQEDEVGGGDKVEKRDGKEGKGHEIGKGKDAFAPCFRKEQDFTDAIRHHRKHRQDQTALGGRGDAFSLAEQQDHLHQRQRKHKKGQKNSAEQRNRRV